MLDQRRRRWADIVQMLYKCFVFDGCAADLYNRPQIETTKQYTVFILIDHCNILLVFGFTNS